MSTELNAIPPWPFSIGRVLRDTFRILRSNLANCTIVVVADIVLWHVVFLLADDLPADEFSWWNFTIRALWSSIVGGFVTAALIYAALVTLSGSRASPRDLARGLSFSISVTVVFFIVEFPTMCSALLGTMDPDPDRSLVPQVAIASASYILYVLWFAAAPAVIAEGLGPLAALKRGASLTAGQRWPIFGLIFMVGLSLWGLQWVAMITGNALNVEVGHTGPNLIFWIADYLLPAVGLVFWAAAQTATYCALRVAKEGVVTAELARVFD